MKPGYCTCNAALGAVNSDDHPLHFGAIVCCMGVRYKSYCSNIVRTMLVDPDEDVQKTYEFLVKVEEEILSKLQHGEFVAAVCLLVCVHICIDLALEGLGGRSCLVRRKKWGW